MNLCKDCTDYHYHICEDGHIVERCKAHLFQKTYDTQATAMICLMTQMLQELRLIGPEAEEDDDDT